MINIDSELQDIYRKNIFDAKSQLNALNYCSKSGCDCKGLSGWVFEQTIQDELKQILKPYNFQFSEQCKLNTEKLKSNGIVDLKISNGIMKDKVVFIEIKLSGLYSPHDVERYEKYQNVIVSNPNYTYLYITGGESYSKYIIGIQQALGPNNSFFFNKGSSVNGKDL